ncbi:MAG TPA: hypothetical protein ENN80_15040 [Candidatus Hydrogenedentes bacterium]|nr:hypothetical protein [Candidatus Hydrogenedentota bacterium]
MDVELTKELFAEAAHSNEKGLHGHSYRIEIAVEGKTDPALGWLIDYGDIKAAVAPLHAQLDHHFLNEVDDMMDTSLAGVRAWILERLAPKLECLKDVRVSIVGDCAFRPVECPPDKAAGLPARVRFTFEAAQSLPHLAEGHPCRRLHGHTYRIGVGAENLGTLIEPLRTLYEALDHRFLNEIPGLEAATSERLCEWIWQRLSANVAGMSVVVVQETGTARCIYHGR